jgi:hypothetical protein
MEQVKINDDVINKDYLDEIDRLKVSISDDLKCECLVCFKLFRAVTHHLKSAHPAEYGQSGANLYGKIKVPCKFCDFHPSTVQSLIMHIKSIHLKTKVKCPKCDEMIVENYLYEHNLYMHPVEVYQWKCESCAETFKHQKGLEKHLKTETHLSKLKAIEWNQTHDLFILNKSTIAKLKIQLKENYLIQEVINLPTNDINLDTSKPHKCIVCDKSFTRKDILSRHILTHSENKPHECELCESSFGRRDHLTRHVRDIHDITYVDCQFCHQQIRDREYSGRHRALCERNIFLNQYPGNSSWERIVSKYLQKKGFAFVMQKKYGDLVSLNGKVLPFDFYIEALDWIIETHGKQHYEKTNYSNAEAIFERTQRHDKLKAEYAQVHCAKFNVIDTRKYNSEVKIFKYLDDLFEGVTIGDQVVSAIKIESDQISSAIIPQEENIVFEEIEKDKLSEKQCVKCNEVKAIENYRIKLISNDGYQPHCNQCVDSFKKKIGMI